MVFFSHEQQPHAIEQLNNLNKQKQIYSKHPIVIRRIDPFSMQLDVMNRYISQRIFNFFFFTRIFINILSCHFSQIILLLKEQNKVEEMVEYAHRACRLYQQQGSYEAGAGALEKTSKMVESKYPASAINVLQHAVEVLMVNYTKFNGNSCKYFSLFQHLILLSSSTD